MRELLDAWVNGRDELPIDAVLAKMGLEVRRDSNGKRGRGALGVRLRTSDGRAVVASVLRGRAAHKAGFDPGDEIIAIGGKRVEGGKIDTALNGRAPGSSVEVTVSRDGRLRTLNVTLDAAPLDRVKIALAEGATAAQRSLLQGWLHGLPAR
jgi:predicted metalloprotease with PDZ domain